MIFTRMPLETFIPTGYMSSLEYYEFDNGLFVLKSYPSKRIIVEDGYKPLNWLESIYMILMYHNPSEEALEFLMSLREEFLSFEFDDLCPYHQNYLNFVMKFYS